MKAGAIVLAGGRSTRMGTNKAFLKINEIPNIERILMCLRPAFSQLFLITNDIGEYRFLDVKTASDHYPGKGPLAGIHAGLIASPFDTNIIVACDMPFVSAELAEVLVNKSDGFDAVVPVIQGRQQPLFAVYKKKLASVIEDLMKEDRLRMKDLLEVVNVLYLTEKDLKLAGRPERFFFNMNRPQEYEEAVLMAKEEHPERGS